MSTRVYFAAGWVNSSVLMLKSKYSRQCSEKCIKRRFKQNHHQRRYKIIKLSLSKAFQVYTNSLFGSVSNCCAVRKSLSKKCVVWLFIFLIFAYVE